MARLEKVYEFGPYRLDAGQNLLFRRDQLIALPPKATLTLVVLVENHGRLVEKEALMKAVWPDTFVEESNLTLQISSLRKILQEESNNGSYIETIPRRGYRFVATVVEKAESISQETRAVATVRPARAPRRSARFYIAAAISCLVVMLVIGLAVWKGTAGPGAAPDIHSLAVLPLRNLSGDPAQEYLADGLTEELVTDLAQLHGLRVISRTSVMPYKATEKKLPEIARELSVDAMVEGSIVRSGDRVRVTAQLVEARHDAHLWAASYDSDLHDLLSIQSSIAQAIADQVRATLTPREKLRLARVRQVSPEAHEAYLLGRHFWNLRTPQAMLKSIELFEKAIRINPNYAEAYAGMSSAYITLMDSQQFPPLEMEEKARAAAENYIVPGAEAGGSVPAQRLPGAAFLLGPLVLRLQSRGPDHRSVEF